MADIIYADSSKTFGTSEADTIEGGYGATINAGAGDDLIKIWGYGNVIEYGTGDGNDTVTGFYENSILKLTSGEITSVEAVGINAKVDIGTGSVLLTGMAGRTINISDAAGTVLKATTAITGSQAPRKIRSFSPAKATTLSV